MTRTSLAVILLLMRVVSRFWLKPPLNLLMVLLWDLLLNTGRFPTRRDMVSIGARARQGVPDGDPRLARPGGPRYTGGMTLAAAALALLASTAGAELITPISRILGDKAA